MRVRRESGRCHLNEGNTLHQGKRLRRRRELKEGMKLRASLARLETGTKTPVELSGLRLHFHGRHLMGDVWRAIKPISLEIRGKLFYLSPISEKNKKESHCALGLAFGGNVLSRI